MKIVLLQDQLRVGGTERQTLFLAQYFQEKGIDCHLILFRPGGHLAQEPKKRRIPHTILQGFDSKLSFWAPNLIKKLQSMKPDVILCMGRTANCYAGRIQTKLPASHVVGTLRTGKSLFPLHSWSLRKVKSLIVNSNWWERQLLRKGIPQERILVAHNSMLLDRPHEESQNWRNFYRDQYGIAEDTPLFLNVSTFRKGKRHRDLLKAFQLLRNQYPDLKWKLWLVGDGPEFRSCRRWVARNGLGTRIRFFHYQKDPLPFYAASDVAVSASREDSLPNFLIEAQATGLPIVAFDCRGVKECCLPGKTGVILEPPGLLPFAEALASFAQDPKRIQEFAKQAPGFATEKFAQGPQADRILAFLQDRSG